VNPAKVFKGKSVPVLILAPCHEYSSTHL